ncbi:MAG: hypothetical protein H0X29_03585 [Parachlamydiaceae bacterium]|nr:hypothetical protein [Parachlamydiaceae bacterium]
MNNQEYAEMPKQWRLNTSNLGKLKELQKMFAQHGYELTSTQIDLREIDADSIKVIVHKASQLGERILVEDTSLEIEGAKVGVNIRWLLDHLPNYVGHKAQWQVLLAYHHGDKVYIFRGLVNGVIVTPRGNEGFGFDPVFLPDGSTWTLAERKSDHVNARALAVKALINNKPMAIESVMTSWTGPWQDEDH